MRSSAFFRCVFSNSEAYTKLRTKPFILSMGVDCSNSINLNRVQVLINSKNSLLFLTVFRIEPATNFQRIVHKSLLTKRQIPFMSFALQCVANILFCVLKAFDLFFYISYLECLHVLFNFVGLTIIFDKSFREKVLMKFHLLTFAFDKMVDWALPVLTWRK